MAESPQHPLQIMENKTRFDLNTAVENWRHELAAQPSLVTDERRELETHLRDALAELRTRGLNDEESFWLARRRVGPPQKLAEEFVKADPAKVWRERIFWFVLGLLIIRLWNILVSCLTLPIYAHASSSHRMRFEDILPQWILFYLPHWLRDFSYLAAAFLLVQLINLIFALAVVHLVKRGKLQKIRLALAFACKSRARFVAMTIMFAAAVFTVANFVWSFAGEQQAAWNVKVLFTNNVFWLFWLTTLVVWLMPTQNRKTQKHA